MQKAMAASLAALVAMSMTAAHGQEQTIRPANRNIKDLQIRGRVQTQFGYTDVDNDVGSDDYSTFEVRRARIGLRGTLFQNVRAQVEANLVPGEDLSMRSAFLQLREQDIPHIKVGYDKPWFGFEENTSSAEILTVERTLIGNTLAPGPVTGLGVEHSLGILGLRGGIYTDRDNRNADGTSDYLFNVSAEVTLDEMVGEGNALRIRADYLNSDDPGGNAGGTFDDAYSLSVHAKAGSFDFRAEYMLGDKDGNEISGWYIMPSLYLTEKLQAVVRLEMTESDRAGGLNSQSRYVRRAPGASLGAVEATDDTPAVNPFRGDDYQAIYVGLNYYFANHSNKLMAGVELSTMKNTSGGDLDATTAFTAWRMLF